MGGAQTFSLWQLLLLHSIIIIIARGTWQKGNESGDIVLWPLLHLNFNVLSWPGVHVEVQILIPQVLGEVLGSAFVACSQVADIIGP